MSKVDNISGIPVSQQVRALPLDVVEELKALFEKGSITTGLMLEMLQEQGFIADGVKHSTFRKAMSRVHHFKQREHQSHGYLSEHPEYLTLWDWEKNQREGISPESLTLKSTRQAWFKCPKNLHASEKREIKGQTKGYGCSKCAYEAQAEAFAVPKKGRSLLEVYPQVAAEYDAGGNEISSKDVAARSDKVFAFIPSCGNHLHRTYKQRVADRTINEDNWTKAGNRGSWCPWCSNEIRSKFHGEVCEFISSLIPLESGADALVNQMVLPDDCTLPEGARQGSEIDFLSWDLGLAVEIHGYDHDRDPEGYTDSKAQRSKELGLDFFVVWQKDWDDPQKREYLKEQLKAIVGFKVMDFMKSQSRAVSNSFWNGDAA